MRRLLDSLEIGFYFALIAFLSTYWSKRGLEWGGRIEWYWQALILWIAFSALFFFIDIMFPRKDR